MIAYVSAGAHDIRQARRVDCAFLPELGYGVTEGPGGPSYVPPVSGAGHPPPDFYVEPTFDGRPATAGNGAMAAFQARGLAQVRDLHTAALAAGGADEGAPGFRDTYGPRSYLSHPHDPQGNKVAIFSSNPAEPGRDD